MSKLSIVAAAMLGMASAQTFPQNICSGGASDYLPNKPTTAGSPTTCSTLVSMYSGLSPPTTFTATTCAQATGSNDKSTWGDILTSFQSYGCCASYVSACAKFIAPANECSGGQSDFTGGVIIQGTTTCGMYQTAFENSLVSAKLNVPPYSGSWTPDQCAQTVSGQSVASAMTVLQSCCKSGKLACSVPSPAPASSVASCFSGEDSVTVESGASKFLSEVLMS